MGDPKDEQPEQPEPGPAEPAAGSEARPAAGRRAEAGSAAAGSEPSKPQSGPLVRTVEGTEEGPAERRGFSFRGKPEGRSIRLHLGLGRRLQFTEQPAQHVGLNRIGGFE